jgi:hypothetical protein
MRLHRPQETWEGGCSLWVAIRVASETVLVSLPSSVELDVTLDIYDIVAILSDVPLRDSIVTVDFPVRFEMISPRACLNLWFFTHKPNCVSASYLTGTWQ